MTPPSHGRGLTWLSSVSANHVALGGRGEDFRTDSACAKIQTVGPGVARSRQDQKWGVVDAGPRRWLLEPSARSLPTVMSQATRPPPQPVSNPEHENIYEVKKGTARVHGRGREDVGGSDTKRGLGGGLGAMRFPGTEQ